MNPVLLALGQSLFAIVFTCVSFFLIFVAPWAIVDWVRARNENKKNQLLLYPFDAAEVRHPGAWQYNHDFLDKVTEFQHDFSGR